MKIKVIDLLNKIANNEWIPIKIKYNDCIYEYENNEYGYVREENRIYYMFLKEIGNSFLNDEVEIIEEEKKIPEKLEIYDDMINWCCNGRAITDTEKDIIDKINEIIDYLKSKGE